MVAVVDGLKGVPEAIPTVFPDALVRAGIVHLARPSLTLWSWKDRKVVAADLRRIHSAPTAERAEAERGAAEQKCAGTYASIAPAWRRAWQEGTPFFLASIRRSARSSPRRMPQNV